MRVFLLRSAKDIASMSAVSNPLDSFSTVNRTALPPGRICGQRWVNSPLSTPVNVVGGPPTEETRARRLYVLKMMSPSSPHLPPMPAGASHKVIAGPPSTEIFCSFPCDENATHRPSGEKKGALAP